jgi:hypothetical protein
MLYKNQILGRNPDTSSQKPRQLFLEPLTVYRIQLLYIVTEKEGKLYRKPYPLPYGLRNP